MRGLQTLLMLSAFLLAWSLPAFAQDPYTDGQNAVKDVFPQGGQELLDATAVEALPSYSASPSETALYGNEAAMVTAGQTALSADTGAGAAYSRAISPNYMSDAEARNVLSAGLAVEADPLAVVGTDLGLAGQYGACTDSAVYGQTSTRYGCEVSGTSRNETQSCEYTGRPHRQSVWVYTTSHQSQRDWLVGTHGCSERSNTMIPGPIPRRVWEVQCDAPV
ncbi:MAG: hypothetical protein AAFW60_03790, partial [Pseudomonadota bacterium]